MGGTCSRLCANEKIEKEVIGETEENGPRSLGNRGTGLEGVDEDTIGGVESRDSDATIWFDALDRFPTDRDMMYPPTTSMRSLEIDFDMQETKRFSLLLNSSVRQLSVGGASSSSPPTRRSKNVRPSVAAVSRHLKMETPGTQGMGYPGELTEDELDTCLEFREQLKKRDPAFKEMVMAMHPHENEAFALCRILRSRDFDIENVFEMLSEKDQLKNWQELKGRDPNFFEDFHNIPEFNGCPLPVFLTQFPLLHTGIGKNGAIIGYCKIGRISCPGIECIAGDMINAVPFVWNRLYHSSRNAIEREISRSDASTTTVLAEQILVADLAGDSALFTTGMGFLKASSSISSCFPERVNRTYVLNAPFSFSVIWTVLRQLIDPRTVKKIGFFSTIPKAKKDFLEYVDSDQLLSDYGGTGNSFDEVFAERLRELAHKSDVHRYVVELLTMNGKQIGFEFDLSGDERVDSIVVYSRSDNMCEISVVDGRSNSVVEDTTVSRDQATSKATPPVDAPNSDKSFNNYAVEIATPQTFAEDVKGPFYVNTKGGTKGDYFLVAVSIGKN